MASKLLLTFVIYHLISTVGLTMESPRPRPRLSNDAEDLQTASLDFGRMSRVKPLAVLHPTSAEDVISLVKAAYGSARGFTVSARGHGHSINGQAQTADGVVIEMSGVGSKSRRLKPIVSEDDGYVDVWGGELWIDVLRTTLQYQMSPKSWTDYLYLSVGGTLSNGGISGQAFNHGPQINNVFELDVVTGKGELFTCSKQKNSDLFHGVLGGLGQFGIITRARIALEPAPHRVRWIRVLYSNFSTFTKDQEYLISLHGEAPSDKFDYVEGFVIVDEEITKNYDASTASNVVDQQVDALLKKLHFIPSTVFTTDIPYTDFLDRVHKAELKLRAKDLWDVPHPWLNLFVPKSRIADFDKGVFKGILGNKTSGPILIYPMNKNKWDYNNSAVTPDEDIFYLVALLRSALDTGEETQTLEYLSNQNRRILRFCDEAGIKVKQYLPEYNTQEEWKGHFGDKWELFLKRKMEFDPKRILATGQRIFRPSLVSSTRSSW
ncbi:hypothetical protein GIB67_001372 [Kingdonia uniflora]|uniref:cytokinin dehydrogenase n=1 Tax=Kingdonia uniflora TaxID=39325 RepID=A0A7J7N7P5_9MAGN|nr:hypothetical protein GIB67_001372 [Kingdonia uniflora]